MTLEKCKGVAQESGNSKQTSVSAWTARVFEINFYLESHQTFAQHIKKTTSFVQSFTHPQSCKINDALRIPMLHDTNIFQGISSVAQLSAWLPLRHPPPSSLNPAPSTHALPFSSDPKSRLLVSPHQYSDGSLVMTPTLLRPPMARIRQLALPLTLLPILRQHTPARPPRV